MKSADLKHFETHIIYEKKSSSIAGAYRVQYKSIAFIVESDPHRPETFFNLTLINLGTKKPICFMAISRTQFGAIITKGQKISKAIYGVLNSSKKMNAGIIFTT